MRRTALTRSLVFGGLVAAVLAFGATAARAAYSAQIVGGTLQITGNGASDKLALRLQAGVPTVLEVDVGDDGTADFSFDRSLFTAVDVTAGGGNDLVRIDQSNGFFTDEAITIDGGKGNDTLLGGDGADILIGGDNSDFVDGNRGDDVAFLGTGNDTFHWDPGDGSDTVEGQAGNDLLDFSGANVNEQIELSANGQRVRFFRDVATITMDLDGVEQITFHALGGADTITADDLTGTAAKIFTVDLAAAGGGGDAQADTVVVKGTNGPDKVKATAGSFVKVAGLVAQTRITGSEPANDTLRIQTLDGNDAVSVAAAVNALIQTIVDLGPGA
jgi:Ca2+-binding RTX toxin-like protein